MTKYLIEITSGCDREFIIGIEKEGARPNCITDEEIIDDFMEDNYYGNTFNVKNISDIGEIYINNCDLWENDNDLKNGCYYELEQLKDKYGLNRLEEVFKSL